MPKISDIENTPNPDARKFILKEPLTYGIIKSFDDKAEADKDELASEIFQINNVVSVFYVDNWITITQDGHADWKVLMRQIADIIREAPSAKKEDDQLKKNISWLENITNLTEIEKSKLEEISEILDEEIRPYLQGDGGDVHIVSFENNILSIHYQGACGSCPSSLSGTLYGIQNLVQRIDPEIKVVPV